MRQDEMVLLKNGTIVELNNEIGIHMDSVLVGFKNTLFRKGKKTGFEQHEIPPDGNQENSLPIRSNAGNNEQWVVDYFEH